MPVRPLTCLAIVGVVGIVISLGACSKSTPAGGTATLPTAPPTTADPWAVPTTITPDYLNKVLAKLNQIDGDAFRDARAARSVTPTFLNKERSIRSSDSEVQLETKDLQANIDKGFAGIKGIPGNRAMTVRVILPAPQPCVLVQVSLDLSAVTDGPPLPYPAWYVALVPREPTALNPTRWVLSDDGFEPGGTSPNPAHACA